jgi:hypothetical protein
MLGEGKVWCCKPSGRSEAGARLVRLAAGRRRHGIADASAAVDAYRGDRFADAGEELAAGDGGLNRRLGWQFCLARHSVLGDPSIMPGTETAPLPTNVSTLQATVLAHAAELAEVRTVRREQDAARAAARADIIEQRFEIEALKARLAKLLRATFGRSSEKVRDRVEELELTLAGIDEMLAETAPPDEPADAGAAASPSKGQRPLPEALPRDIVAHAAPCSCPT